MNKVFAITVVFVTGISVTALEISSARLVAPFFGSTIYVWGGSIATALGALALGYWLGGKIIDRVPQKIIIGLALLTAGITSVVIPLWYSVVMNGVLLWTKTLSIPVSLSVMVSMILLFLVPLVAMGMVSPMVLRLSLRDMTTAGAWSGALSGASTVGSIVGTFASAYATIPLVGTRATILGAGALLIILSSLFFNRRSVMMGSIPAVLLIAAPYLSLAKPLITRPGLLWAKESAYELVQVVQQGNTRKMYFDRAVGGQSIYVLGQPYSQTLYDSFGLLPYLVHRETKDRSVLVVGMAGGTAVRPYVQVMRGQFNFSITGVEIDPEAIEAAKRYFDINSLGTTIINADARYFLATHPEQYDIIIVDAYTNELVIPPMLATTGFFQQLKTHVADGGIVAFNAAALSSSRYYPKFINTLAAVFPDVRHAPFSPGSTNHLIVAGTAIDFTRLPQNLSPVLSEYQETLIPTMARAMAGGPVYTDDRTDLDIRVRPFVD